MQLMAVSGSLTENKKIAFIVCANLVILEKTGLQATFKTTVAIIISDFRSKST